LYAEPSGGDDPPDPAAIVRADDVERGPPENAARNPVDRDRPAGPRIGGEGPDDVAPHALRRLDHAEGPRGAEDRQRQTRAPRPPRSCRPSRPALAPEQMVRLIRDAPRQHLGHVAGNGDASFVEDAVLDQEVAGSRLRKIARDRTRTVGLDREPAGVENPG